MEEGTRAGEIVSEGVTLARDLANHPGNEMTPTVLAERSMEMAEAVGLRCDVLDEEAMEREGMGALLAVARGSDQPPRLIVMEHEDGGRISNRTSWSERESRLTREASRSNAQAGCGR